MSSQQKVINMLSMLRRMIDEPTLIQRFHKRLSKDTLTLGDESIAEKSINKLFSLLLDGYKRHNQSSQFNINTFAVIVRQESDKIDDEELSSRIQAYLKLLMPTPHPTPTQEKFRLEIQENAKNDTVLNEILARIKLHSFYQWHEKDLKGLLSKGDINSAVHSMHNITEDLKELELHSSKPFDWDKLETIIANAIENNADSKSHLAFNLTRIDEELMGGFYRSTLNGFMAVSGGGKSQMCTHLISLCVLQKMRVHVVSVEEEARLFSTRLVAAVSGVETRKIQRGVNLLTPEEKQSYYAAIKEIKKYVVLEFIYDKGIEEIHRIKKEYLESVNRRRAVAAAENTPMEDEISVDILDYSGHLASQIKGEKMHEKMLEAYKVRKNYALKHNLVAFDFIQPNRDGTKRENDSGVLRSTDIAGGFDIVRVFDNLMSINRGPRDIEMGTARIYVDKCRSGDLKGKTYQVNTEFHRGRYDTSDESTLELNNIISVTSGGNENDN